MDSLSGEDVERHKKYRVSIWLSRRRYAVKSVRNYSEQDCAELHSPYEIVVVTGKNPSQQLILYGFLHVIMNAIHNNIGKR